MQSGQSFFAKGQYDSRFKSSDHRIFSPNTSITSQGPIEFILPPMKSMSIYMLKDVLMMVKVKLTQKDGSAVPAAGEVAGKYSRVPNNRVGWNKRVGTKKQSLPSRIFIYFPTVHVCTST